MFSGLKKINFSIHSKIILSIIFFCFFVAANFAWLNPHPESKAYKTTSTIPFFWQYNADAGVEILTSAYFPTIFHTYKSRMERPTYPIISKLLGEGVGIILSPFKNLSNLEKAGAGYVLLKLIIFSIFAFTAYHILNLYVPKNYSLFFVFLLMTHNFALKTFSMFHTLELQFITPTVITLFYINLIKKYSNLKNVFFSIIVGVLLLGKSNYAIYLGFLSYSLLHKRFFEVFISFVGHFIPFLAYFYYLSFYDFEFYSLSKEIGMGSWIFNQNLFSFVDLFKLIFFSIFDFFLNSLEYFHILFFSAILGFFVISPNNRKSFLLLFIIFLFFTWLQGFFANRDRPYMTSDLSIFIFGLSALFLAKYSQNLKIKKNFLFLGSLIWLLYNLLILINLPYEHPNKQLSRDENVLQQRLHMIENYELYDKEQIRENKDGKIFYPDSQ